MRVLVTGGAGFIGSQLCDAFLERGDDVVAVDNLLTGSRANLAHLEGKASFRLRIADVAEPLDDPPEVDLVCHLASPASPVGYGAHPIETLAVNGMGTFHLLRLCREQGARFMLASTSEIYGDPLRHPQSEDYWGNVNPVGPRSCYDEGKRYAEALTVNHGAQDGLDYRIARIFNTYGPRSLADDGRILPNFVSRALSGRPLEVFGDGSQTRSYCYVSDLVRGLVALASEEAARGQIVNLGNPDERSVSAIAGEVLRLTASRSKIVHVAARPEEIARRQPDITKATKLLGWRAEVSLEEGLARTIEWFKARAADGAADS